MTIKQKIVMVTMMLGLTISFSIFPSNGTVLAQEEAPPVACQIDPESENCKKCLAGQSPSSELCQRTKPDDSTEDKPSDDCVDDADTTCCGNVETSIIKGPEFCGGAGTDNTTAERSTIWNLLLQVLKIMTAGIGIAAVGGIVFGALLYTTAEDKPEQTKRAIGIITNVVIGLVAYGLMFVLLNWLIPGGIFS